MKKDIRNIFLGVALLAVLVFVGSKTTQVSALISNSTAPTTLTAFKSHTLIGNNTTTAVPLFRVTGVVRIKSLSGTVTTVLGSNVTAAYWRFNDQTAQSNITASAGTTLSSFTVGSAITKLGLAATALTGLNASQERVSEPATANTMYFQDFVLTAKNGANSDVEFVYTTTNTPTSGVINFKIEYEPVSADGALVAI